MAEKPCAGDVVSLNRGERVVQLRVPTPDELDDAVVDLAVAAGMLRGLADSLAPRPDVGHVAPTIHEAAGKMEALIDRIEVDGGD